MLKETRIRFAPSGERKSFGTYTAEVRCFHLAFEEWWRL